MVEYALKNLGRSSTVNFGQDVNHEADAPSGLIRDQDLRHDAQRPKAPQSR